MPTTRIALAIMAAMAALLAGEARALTQAETDALIRTVDDRQQNNGDFAALCYMEAKEKDKTDVVYELVYYRRSEGQRLLILFTKPKSEAGKGYLRLEKNLWLYDPATGKWERRTERERIGGTDSRR
ncbi:MAG TPA: outer membrane lipoprotein-sorting protein, partial [Anaeromyxobacteraceae bacterium]|nr:outer membrane lipoprotein-sorting protein [Anaeromyxobacteraceae bacterium]